MATYFILTEEGFQYALDATSDISYDLTGRASKNPVETGFVVSDTYINENDRVTLSGVISSSSLLGGANSGGLLGASTTLSKTELFKRGLRTLKESGNTFSVQFSADLPALTDCVFESLTFSQNSTHGTAVGDGTFSASYEVSMTITQINRSEVVEVTTTLAPEKSDDSVKDSTQPLEEGSQNTKSVTAIEAAILRSKAADVLIAEGVADIGI